MKALVVFLFVSICSMTANTYSQGKDIQLNVKNTRVKDVFTKIEEQSSYLFLLSENIENKLNKKIDITIDSDSLEEVLELIVSRANLQYEVVDKQVVIYDKQSAPESHSNSVEDVEAESEPEQQPAKRTITGLVTDKKDGLPVIGANVVVVKEKTGTITNDNGQFSLSVPPGATIRISFIGYVTQEIKITDQTTLSIQLVEDEAHIDEVVITGYANIRKESFTGSVTQISKDDIFKVSSGNLISSIQTFDPSFRIMENIELGSDPNALPEFYMRGQSGLSDIRELDILEKTDVSQFSLRTNPNTPIFILDGFEVSVEKIYDIDLTRVKSVTLLKDASSTAIYGSRAANGVIVIETITPKAGDINVNYSGYYTFTAPDLTSYNLMNTREKLQAEENANFFGDPEPWEYRNSTFETAKRIKRLNYINKYNQLLRGVDTYWLSQPLESAFNNKHTLFVEGGIDAFRIGVEARYDIENGVMKESSRNRKGVGLTTEYIAKKIQIRNQVSFNIMSNKNSPYGTFNQYVRLQPYYEIYDPESGELNSTYSSMWGATRSAVNPLYESSLGNFDRGGYKEWINNLSINWFVTQQLLLKGQYAITYNDADTQVFKDPESTTFDRSVEYLKRGDLKTSNTKRLNHNANLFAAYNQAFNEHYINLSLGVNVTASTYDYVGYHYRGFSSKHFASPAFAFEIVDKPTFSDNVQRLMGSFFISNYSYKNIYLLDTSVRVDGSSEFGTKRKWAPFWSFGLGINFHNYPLLKNNDFITQLRVTANSGVLGKANFSPYMSNNMFEIFMDDWYPTGIGTGLIYLGNENLAWEKTQSNNLAADLTLMNRYFFRFDLYNKITKNLINDVSLPTSSGFKVFKDNVGEISNRGFEVKANLGIVRSRDLSVYLFGNIAHNVNRIEKISESLKRYNERVDEYFKAYSTITDPFFYTSYHSINRKFSTPIKKFEEGASVTAIYGMESLGINPANGKEVYRKRDGSITYDWTSSEQQVIGNTEPWGQGSFGLNTQYKRWSFYTTFLYEFGGDRYNQTLVNEVENVDLINSNADRRVVTDRWVKIGDVTPLKDIREGLIITRSTSRFVQKNNFVRFNSLSLGYDFDHAKLKKYGVNMLKLQCNMNDIALFSTIRREMGTSYPFARTVTFTFNIAF
jgi:TonB-linked SusC/RagA family outer membrane protein